MDQRDQQAIAREQNALFGFVREQMLVGGCKLGGEDQRRLGRAERIAGQGMLRAGEMTLQIRPQRQRGTVIPLGQLEPPAFREGDPIGGRQRVADHARCLHGIALERFLEPRLHACGPRFRRIRRTGLQRRKTQGQRHDIGIIGFRAPIVDDAPGIGSAAFRSQRFAFLSDSPGMPQRERSAPA